jgi:hypothetical protein
VKLGNWLRAEQVYFCLRLKKNEFVEQEKELVGAKALELSPGSSLYLAGLMLPSRKDLGCSTWQQNGDVNIADA